MSDCSPQTTKAQIYQAVLADIAMAMAIRTLDPDYAHGQNLADYAPGAIRDGWLNSQQDKLLRMRVKPLATAGTASLQLLAGEELLRQAENYGVPLNAELANEIAEFLEFKRSVAMTYNR
jgi:hypothetical protein